MAPVCVAAHLSLPTLCVFILFLIHVVHKTRLRCDHQTLLDLQPLVQNIVSFGADRQQPLLPVLLEILGYLYWVPTLPSRWKHHCRRGKQSGRLVKLTVSLRNLLFSDQRMGCSQDCWGSQDEQYQDTKLRLSRYSTTTRCFYKWKYREFTTRSKPLVWTRLNRKHLKELHRFEKPRLNYTRIMRKVKYGRERNVSVPEAYHIICQT